MTTEKTLSVEEMDLVKKVYTTLSASPNFKKRNQQRALIAFASNKFANGEIGIAEAPTGVGKTVSYLVSGIASAIINKKRLVVSTATVALQNQVMSKDIVIVSNAFKALGYTINASLIKGRERYVCNIKLMEKSSQNDMFAENKENELINFLQNSVSKSTWDGEIESSKKTIPVTLWNEIKSDRHSCNGEKCPEFNNCGYYKKVNQAKTADVVIVNHSLLLSALMHVPNSIYSDFEKNIYVFDEGHHIPDKANSIFASTIPNEIQWLASSLKGFLQASGSPIALRTNGTLQATILSERLKSASKLMNSYGKGKSFIRFTFGNVPDDVLMYLGEALSALKNITVTHIDYIQNAGKLNRKDTLEFSTMKGKLEEIQKGLENFITTDEECPIAKWAEFNNKEWQLKSSPFDAGGVLYSRIWKSCIENKSGVLITSATLSSSNGFDRFQNEVGLNKNQCTTLMLDTPYTEAYSKVKMIVPRMKNMPENVAGHTVEVTAHIKKAYMNNVGGILVLFASNKQMQDVYKELPIDIQDNVSMQGSFSFSEIILRHTQKVNANTKSMIFGLSTFAEGVDLPGNLCTNVIITKIPFPSPDEPLIAAACEWVNKKTNNGSFGIILMPKAGIRFKQSVGRLIRSDTDYGEITVLDKRLLEKSYGKKLMSNLPVQARYG